MDKLISGLRRSLERLGLKSKLKPPAFPPREEQVKKAILSDIKTMTDEKKFDEGTFINEQERRIIIQLAYTGEGSIVKALGELHLAADIVKQTFSRYSMMDRRGKGIIVPRIEGNGK